MPTLTHNGRIRIANSFFTQRYSLALQHLVTDDRRRAYCGESLPILPLISANQRAPSGPVAMSPVADAFGAGYPVNTPEAVNRPIWPACVNQRAPSGPAVMPAALPAVGIVYSATAPEVVIRPILSL